MAQSAADSRKTPLHIDAFWEKPTITHPHFRATSALIEYNMAQSAAHSRKTPLNIDAFWEKPTITPPLSWDKWTQQWKLALLAKEGIQIETLINGPPSAVTYPPEPTYEGPVENHTQATERDRKVRNQQLKVNWQNRCKKINEIDILCGDKPWELCEQKAVSLLYLCIGIECRRIFKSKYPHSQIEIQLFKDLWQAMYDSFNKIPKLLTIISFSFLPNNRKVNR